MKVFNVIEQINNKTSLVFLSGNIYLDETKTLVPNQKISSQADTLIAVLMPTEIMPIEDGRYFFNVELNDIPTNIKKIIAFFFVFVDSTERSSLSLSVNGVAVRYYTMLNPANSGSYGIYAQLEL